MRKYYNIAIIIFLAAVLISAISCGVGTGVNKDRRVGKVGAEYIYETTLVREVKRSHELIRTREKNDYLGFSPRRELRLMRENLVYLIQITALVLPANTLDRRQVLEKANKVAEELARDIYDRLEAGESWDELSVEYSNNVGLEKGGVLPRFKRDARRLPEGFFDLTPGGLLGPVHDAYGWNIYRLDEKTDDEDPFYTARRIQITVDEKAMKEELIKEILAREQVEIVDPVIKAYDYFTQSEFQMGIDHLDESLPLDEWADLGYYVMSMCAGELGDRAKRKEFLLKSIENSSEFSAFLSYYEAELGGILLAEGNEQGALEHYQSAYDASRNDYDMVVATLEMFIKLGDEEYAETASLRKAEMESINMDNTGGGPSDGTIATGEVDADKPKFDDIEDE